MLAAPSTLPMATLSPTIAQRYRTLSFDVPKATKDNDSYQRNDRRRRSSSGSTELLSIDLSRDYCVDWIHNLNNRFGFDSRTFFLAVSFLDTTLSRVRVKQTHVHCCGVACFMVACKVNEEPEEQPSMRELIVACSGTFSRNDLVRMETLILQHLGFSLTPVTPDTLLICLYECCTEQPVTTDYEVPEPIRWAIKVMERCMCRTSFLRFNPTTIALASLFFIVKRRGICSLLNDMSLDDVVISSSESEESDEDSMAAASLSPAVSYDRIKTAEQVFARLESLFETYAKHIDRETVEECIDELIILEMDS